jgi:hypothetical protein
MAGGDPVEFVRTLLSGNRQRVGNRTQREGFEIEADYCVAPENVDTAATVVLPAPGARLAWRFDYIHYSYDAIIQVPGVLLVGDGVTLEVFYIMHDLNAYLPFESTRWATGAAVTITLVAVPGARGALAVHGARIERAAGW